MAKPWTSRAIVASVASMEMFLIRIDLVFVYLFRFNLRIFGFIGPPVENTR